MDITKIIVYGLEVVICVAVGNLISQAIRKRVSKKKDKDKDSPHKNRSERRRENR
jgi:hypothetical protein